MGLEALKGLKKAKCLYWRQIGECALDIDPEKCGARTPEGYCLSIIVDLGLIPMEAC